MPSWLFFLRSLRLVGRRLYLAALLAFSWRKWPNSQAISFETSNNDFMESQGLRNLFRRVWNSLRDYLNSDNQCRVLELLSEEYTEKSENVLKLRDYAARMVYPQFRDKLLGIAAEEQADIRSLAEHITALGGQIPQVRFAPKAGRNGWERLLTVLEKKKRHGSDRIERLLQLERVAPKLAQALRRMRQEEAIHQRDIQAMMMRSDPQAGINSQRLPSSR